MKRPELIMAPEEMQKTSSRPSSLFKGNPPGEGPGMYSISLGDYILFSGDIHWIKSEVE
jgi:hypothetical protein